MKKILILYATYGSGHKTIAEYIKKYFEESGKYECMTLDLMAYSVPIIGMFSKKISEFLMFRFPFIWSLVYFSFDNKLAAYISGKTSSGIFKNIKLKKIISDFNPDITIATHFYGTDIIYNYNKKKIINSKIVTIVTDYYAHNFWTAHLKNMDAIIVSDLQEKLYLWSRGYKFGNIYTSGIPILPNFGDNLDREKILNKLKINNGKKNVLFFVCGGNGSLYNLIYFKEILKNNYNCNVLLIAGKNKTAYNKACSYVKRYSCKNVKVFGFVTNVNEFYKISDFVVTKPGGAQVTECLFFNKPMLLVKSNGGQEDANSRYLKKKGYAKKAWNRVNFNRYFKELLNDNYRNKMIKKISERDHTISMKKLYEIVERLK